MQYWCHCTGTSPMSLQTLLPLDESGNCLASSFGRKRYAHHERHRHSLCPVLISCGIPFASVLFVWMDGWMYVEQALNGDRREVSVRAWGNSYSLIKLITPSKTVRSDKSPVIMQKGFGTDRETAKKRLTPTHRTFSVSSHLANTCTTPT